MAIFRAVMDGVQFVVMARRRLLDPLTVRQDP